MPEKTKLAVCRVIQDTVFDSLLNQSVQFVICLTGFMFSLNWCTGHGLNNHCLQAMK